MSTKVVTEKVRFSYVHVFEPYSSEEDKPKQYSVSIIIPKKDKKTLSKIQAAIEEALEIGKSKFGGKIPKKYKSPLRDGDEEKEDEAYANSMFVNANSKALDKKPGILDAELNVILDKAEFYSGCYGRASINFYAFNVNGNQGVACGLNGLQKLEDGEDLSGRTNIEEDFADNSDLL